MEQTLEWLFERFSPNGSTGGSGLRRSLEGSGLEEANKLAREAIQNSADAALDADGLVEVVIRLVHLSGDDRSAFMEILSMEKPGGPREHQIPVELPDPLPLLFIEDYGTVGLGGVESSEVSRNPQEDRFVGLCRNFGDTPAGAHGGGTFGFGKVVYWRAGEAGLALFYSRFKPTTRSGSTHARLIGAALFNQHDLRSTRYTGRAWLGRLDVPRDYAAPLVDRAAHEIARKIGFVPRDAGKEGTSILVVNTHFSSKTHMESLRTGIEMSYWPRLVDQGLLVKLYVDGEQIPGPNPAENPLVAPLIPAYKLCRARLRGESIPVEKGSQTEILKRHNLRLGALSLTTSTGPSEPHSEDDEVLNSVALIRGPRMVVEYHPIERLACDFIGVFVAAPDINAILAKSEPPAHNHWDDRSEGLKTEEQQIVKFLMRRKLREQVRDFIRQQLDEASEKTPDCPDLGRELARILSLPGTSQPGKGASPVSLVYRDEPHIVEERGQAHVEATLEVTIGDLAARQEFGDSAAAARFLEVSFKPRVVVDDEDHDSDMMPVLELQLDPPGGETIKDKDRLQFEIGDEAFSKRIRVRTGARRHPEQTIDFQTVAVLKGEQGQNMAEAPHADEVVPDE